MDILVSRRELNSTDDWAIMRLWQDAFRGYLVEKWFLGSLTLELMAQSSEVPVKRVFITKIPLQCSIIWVGHYISQLTRYFNLFDDHSEYTYYYGFFSKNLVGSDHPIQRLRNQLPKTPWFRKAVRQSVFALSGLFHSEFDLYFEPNFIPV